MNDLKSIFSKNQISNEEMILLKGGNGDTSIDGPKTHVMCCKNGACSSCIGYQEGMGCSGGAVLRPC